MRERPLSLQVRMMFICGFILIVTVLVTFTPDIAKEIAYSWTIGTERAKAEVARQFLAENPVSEQRIAWVAKAVVPCVVGVHVITSRAAAEYGALRGIPGMIESELGSGVIIDTQEGYILTNFHVIENAHAISIRLSDGREVEAEIVGQDRMVDLAVLRIDLDDLEAVVWGDSRQVSIGEQVVAVGSPYGLLQTVTSGIISATDRYPSAQPAQRTRRDTRPIPQPLLQTDAAINHGNSGGALVDMDGKLIGICTSIISMDNGGNSGIGFAIPSFTARRVFEEIVQHGKVKHGWIGTGLVPVTSFESRQLNQKKPMGAVIQNFRNDSPAKDAGLQVGDIILRWGDTEIDNPLHLIHIITLTQPGSKETVEVYRKGEILTIEITVGTRPNDL